MVYYRGKSRSRDTREKVIALVEEKTLIVA